MGLLDLLTSAKSGGGAAAPEAKSGLMSKLNYGGVPFGIRLMAAAEALRTIENPDISRPGLALMARAKEKSDESKKEAEKLAELREKAERLAAKVELTNPQLAEALRADPTLVSDYGKNIIGDMFYERNRGDQIEDRDAGFAHTEKGWGVQDARQEDQQQHEIAVNEQESEIAMSKLQAEWARDDALRQGRKADAKAIADEFLGRTGVALDPPSPELEPRVPQSAPGPSPIPMPMPGSVAPTPEVVPGLTQPGATGMPDEQGDAGEAPPQQVSIWQQKFEDPSLTPTEAAQLTYAFTNALSASAQDGKDPDSAIALGAAAEVYRKILERRTAQQTANAATSEAETKANEANRKQRIDAQQATEKATLTADARIKAGDAVLDAISDAEAAADPKNADYLPATGAGSWLAGFVGDVEVGGKQIAGNARAIYNALNTVKANLGFDALQAIKDASVTGGALGQIAVQELVMLQSTVAELDPTDKNFKKNLQQVKELYTKVKEHNENLKIDIENMRADPAKYAAEFDELYGVDAHLKFIGE